MARIALLLFKLVVLTLKVESLMFVGLKLRQRKRQLLLSHLLRRLTTLELDATRLVLGIVLRRRNILHGFEASHALLILGLGGQKLRLRRASLARAIAELLHLCEAVFLRDIVLMRVLK